MWRTSRPRAVSYTHLDVYKRQRINMAYSSSVVTYGRGRGVVTAIAMDTEVGRIAHMLQQEGDRMTPLQQKLEKLGKTCLLYTSRCV